MALLIECQECKKINSFKTLLATVERILVTNRRIVTGLNITLVENATGESESATVNWL